AACTCRWRRATSRRGSRSRRCTTSNVSCRCSPTPNTPTPPRRAWRSCRGCRRARTARSPDLTCLLCLLVPTRSVGTRGRGGLKSLRDRVDLLGVEHLIVALEQPRHRRLVDFHLHVADADGAVADHAVALGALVADLRPLDAQRRHRVE